METSKLVAMIGGKCPKCRKGSIYKNALYSSKFHEMNDSCPHCKQNFWVEPGFYLGAMYISYAFQVAAMFIVGFLTFTFVEDPSIWVMLLYVGGIVLVTLPLIFRISRSIYLHLFSEIKYESAEKTNN